MNAGFEKQHSGEGLNSQREEKSKPQGASLKHLLIYHFNQWGLAIIRLV